MKKETLIVHNQAIRFGKPTIKGTRITVDDVMGWLAAGMDYEEIKKEYGIAKEQIVAAIQYMEGWVHIVTEDEIRNALIIAEEHRYRIKDFKHHESPNS